MRRAFFAAETDSILKGVNRLTKALTICRKKPRSNDCRKRGL